MTTETTPRPATLRRTPIPGGVVVGIAGPLLLAITNAVVEFSGVWHAADTAALIPALGDNAVLVETASIIGLMACVLLVPGIWAVTVVLTPRAPRLSAVGGWLMATGYVLAVVLSTDSITGLAVAQSGADPAGYADAIDNHTPVAALVLYAGFGIGALLGGLVLGIAMLRQRGAVPIWAGWALLLSEPVRVAGLMFGVPVGPPLASLLIAAAFAGVLLSRCSADPPQPR